MSVTPALRRILVVDDDRFIRAAVEKILTLGGGYTVKVCESGVEAIKYASDFKPDLILLDVIMPGLDGPATLKALRAMPSTATTPIAFLTATTDGAVTDMLRDLGAIGIFEKPFNPTRLAQDLEDTWASAYKQEAQSDSQQLAAALEALRLEYATALPEEARRIKQEGMEAIHASGGHAALESVCEVIELSNPRLFWS